MPERRIVAFGGRESENQGSPLDDYVLELTGKRQPKVCFVPTAAGDGSEAIVRFYNRFPQGRCELASLSLFRRDVADLGALVREQDVVYVGGGNTANMLAVWRLHGLDAALRDAWESGVVLTGTSAGANCWFEACITDSFGPELMPLRDGLAFLPGSFCPHYDSEENRRPTLHGLVADGFPTGFAAEDEVALHFVGTKLEEVVTPRPDGRAFRVELGDGEVVEKPLQVRRLGYA